MGRAAHYNSLACVDSPAFSPDTTGPNIRDQHRAKEPFGGRFVPRLDFGNGASLLFRLHDLVAGAQASFSAGPAGVTEDHLSVVFSFLRLYSENERQLGFG